MRLPLDWPILTRGGDRPQTQSLTEVVTPRTNAAAVTAAENLLAAVSLPDLFSLEIGATAGQRWFLARAGSEAMRRHLHDVLGAVYPQAELRPLDTTRVPGFDPARCCPGEQLMAVALGLAKPPYLPLRTFGDAEVAADRAPHAAQNDPLTGVLAAMGSVPPGWRTLVQVLLRPAPETWANAYARMALESPLEGERQRLLAPAAAHSSGGRGGGVVLQLLLKLGVMWGAHAAYVVSGWYESHNWWALTKLALAMLVLVAGGIWLWWRWRRATARPLWDPKLVEEKISRVGFVAQVRLAVFAPSGVPRAAVSARLQQLAAAYRPFGRPNGNALEPVGVRLPRSNDPGASTVLCRLAPLPGKRSTPVLNVRELAGLWHLPQEQTEVPLLERTAARQWQPLPADVSRGCRIGVSAHQGRSVPVCVPDELLRSRHSLLVAKTQRGKSSLLRAFARHVMDAEERQPRALLLVDPHRDLAHALLGLVPPDRRGDVVFLDVGAAAAGEHPFGLNLLDTGLGWTADKAVANALLIFQREFGRNWGPRMEDAFRWSLKTLWAANEALCRSPAGAYAHELDDGRGGRGRQYTVLQVGPLLADAGFAEGVLKTVDDPAIHEWWDTYYRALARTQRLEIINPVQTKVQKFAGTEAGRNIVGQSSSTVDPAAWLREGKLVLVDTAKGVVGEDTAALIGGTLLNLFKEVVGEQAALPPGLRRRVTLIVDEFQSVPGADYEALLSELVKYGANLILATQSLRYLDTLDEQHDRALRAAVFANLDGLFAFQCSAEDAEYLVRELGGDVDPKDLLDLPEHSCYAKLSARGQRLPVFSLRLDPPPTSDDALAQRLAAASAWRYGRPIDDVRRHAAALHARIVSLRTGGGGASGDDEVPAAPLGDDRPPSGRAAPPGSMGGAAAGDARASAQPSRQQPSRSRGERGRRQPKATLTDRRAALGGSIDATGATGTSGTSGTAGATGVPAPGGATPSPPPLSRDPDGDGGRADREAA